MKVYLTSILAGIFMFAGMSGIYRLISGPSVKYGPNKTIVEPIVISKFLGKMTITSYRSVPEQTDSSPFITADGGHISPYGVAVSRDLLTTLKYGDILYIESIGFKVINDKMNKRHTQHIDMWVSSLNDERKFHSQYKGKKVKVYLVSLMSESIH